MIDDKFKSVIKNLPKKPGVYRFYAEDDSVLYIGKAKNLKNRVSSYFQDGRPHNERLTLMISQIDRIEYSVVQSEDESLILEANLIHNLQPKYNILLKDDKNYVYVRITNDAIPGIFLVRKKFDPNSQYFGPYTKKSGIFETLRTLRTIFPYCQERYPRKRPCSYVSIKKCEGICIGLESMEDYKLKIAQISKVLSGQTDSVEEFLQTKISEAVSLSNFALASLWRDRLKILKSTISDQKIILPQPQNIDIITLIFQTTPEGMHIGSIYLQNIRDGKIVNVNNFLLTGTDDSILEQTTDVEKTGSEVAFSMLQRFLSSYRAFQVEKSPALIQVLESQSV
ncbi:MAG: GIY-YIG nuclease family protein [Patescibacteria group bacterium]